uniref:F-box domain-containing protein n=1 Tax=Plectus sambesii TaxID=2011161 RepID=A0A914VVM5_9BILA
MAALQAEVARLQAENDQFRRALVDMNGRIVCGQLTGDLPDNFLEQFSQLPDRALEQVLRFLPLGQVAQMRHVSRKFNNVIRKGSKAMPKKECNGSVVFKSCNAEEVTVAWIDDQCKKIMKTTTISLADEGVALSELFRFMRIGGKMYFGHGMSAADKVLDQLSKAWLTIRPEMVIFAGDLSQTSRDSLRAFLVKVEPSIERLHFQFTRNIDHILLSDDVIGAAGRLKGLMVMPACLASELRDINIGDRTLLAMVDTDHLSSYVSLLDCSGITPSGIRTFVEKWMKKETPKPRGQISLFRTVRHLFELTFDNCANLTPAAVGEACDDLLKTGTMKTIPRAWSIGNSGERNAQRVTFTVHCPSDDRRLHICLNDPSCLKHIVFEPMPVIMAKDKIAFNYDNHSHDDLNPEMEDDDIDAYARYNAIDYDDDENSDSS